jgi:hypothetical protein
MLKKRFSAEQIVTLLRQIEVSMAQGKSAQVACQDRNVRDWMIQMTGRRRDENVMHNR